MAYLSKYFLLKWFFFELLVCSSVQTNGSYNTYITRAEAYEFASTIVATRLKLQLTLTLYRFGLFPFRSPLLRELTIVLFSCSYWEVSLHYVLSIQLINFTVWWLDMTLAGLPHSEILGSKLVRQLPETYRSLPRPSSTSCAKASTMCPYFAFWNDYFVLFDF